MNIYDFYITPAEYKAAELNGVDPANLDRRIRLLGWEKEKAISTPLEKKTNRKAWAKIAAENGIKYSTFMSRINNYGMSEEEAATKPLQNRKKAAEKMTEFKTATPKEWRQVAYDNGINYFTFRERIRKGMDPAVAATQKLMTKSEAGKKGAKVTEDRHGRFHKLIFN